LTGDDTELHSAFLNEENGIGGVALRENLLVFLVVGKRPSLADLRQKALWIEKRF